MSSTILPPPSYDDEDDVTLESFVGLVGQAEYWEPLHDTDRAPPPDDCEDE